RSPPKRLKITTADRASLSVRPEAHAFRFFGPVYLPPERLAKLRFILLAEAVRTRRILPPQAAELAEFLEKLHDGESVEHALGIDKRTIGKSFTEARARWIGMNYVLRRCVAAAGCRQHGDAISRPRRIKAATHIEKIARAWQVDQSVVKSAVHHWA